MENNERHAKAIARLLEDGKGRNVVLLDISALNGWTDYFVIATVTSSAHWQGLFRDVKKYAKECGLELLEKQRRRMSDGDEWNLIDLGAIVVHLMSEEARAFYDLEKLWHAGALLPFDEAPL